VVDSQNRSYKTVGRLHCEHALARLPLQTAMRLRDLLDEAFAAAAGITAGSPGPRSNATARVGCVTRRRVA
jgi:hypothetical protein